MTKDSWKVPPCFASGSRQVSCEISRADHPAGPPMLLNFPCSAPSLIFVTLFGRAPTRHSNRTSYTASRIVAAAATHIVHGPHRLDRSGQWAGQGTIRVAVPYKCTALPSSGRCRLRVGRRKLGSEATSGLALQSSRASVGSIMICRTRIRTGQVPTQA